MSEYNKFLKMVLKKIEMAEGDFVIEIPIIIGEEEKSGREEVQAQSGCNQDG